jgi:tetratricopeptide (TPR) repeat protein
VKLSGFWIKPVEVKGMSDSQVRYVTSAGLLLTRPMETLEGLRLQQYPLLSKAQDALDRGDDEQAQSLLNQVYAQAKEDWLRDYVRMLRVAALARLDRAGEAAGVYIDMVVSDTPLMFLQDSLSPAVARADAEVRLQVIDLIKAAEQAVSPQRQGFLLKLSEAAGEPARALVASEGATVKAIPRNGLALSSSTPPGTIANLFSSGQYQQALLAADEALTQPGKTSAELYLKGMAQLALAEQTSDPAGYKSAGLSFMRVVTYFLRSAVAGPAWLEAGYVHQRIGRPDIAARLYQRARPLITEGEDPVYYARLMKLTNELDANRSGQ